MRHQIKGALCALCVAASMTAYADSGKMDQTSKGSASSSGTQNVTAQTLNQDARKFIGKQVTFTGTIDRILQNGSYVLNDSGSSKDSLHRILVVPSAKSDAASSDQQAGTAAQKFKEGDKVQVRGKVEQLNLWSESDTIRPKSETEIITETSQSMPVIVVQPGDLKAQS